MDENEWSEILGNGGNEKPAAPSDPQPGDVAPDPSPSPPSMELFSDPDHFRGDAKLFLSMARKRGIPQQVVDRFYELGVQLVASGKIGPRSFKCIAQGLAAIAKVDVETGRYHDGTPEQLIKVEQQTQVNQVVETAAALPKEKTAAEIIQEQVRGMDATILPPAAMYSQIVRGSSGNGHSNGNGHDDGTQPSNSGS